MSPSRRLWARAVAALVALVVSGAPRLAVAVRTGTVHVCQCRAHGPHRCACPVCAEQARRARRSAIEQLPRCHQKLALEELAREEEREKADGSIPCLKPTCGFEDPQGAAPTHETYVAPKVVALAPPQPAEPLAPASDDARETPAVPDVPPPILGR
ncbi:MAG TPA: hypothetical protein VFL83_11405 [Anaeromyxobacter sp.]|nr:hypothetical protein [Anaeromyxobacter sp.]